MLYTGELQGKYVHLRSVLPIDAQFVIDLRNDDSKNMFLHETSRNVQKQIEWIKKQNEKQGDYYFIIENNNGAIGLASIYDIDETAKTAEFGRWISNGNALENVETVIQIFDFTFNETTIDTIYMLTMVDNKRVCNFWKTFGAEIEAQIVKDGLLVEREVITKENYFDKLRTQKIRLLRY